MMPVSCHKSIVLALLLTASTRESTFGSNCSQSAFLDSFYKEIVLTVVDCIYCYTFNCLLIAYALGFQLYMGYLFNPNLYALYSSKGPTEKDPLRVVYAILYYFYSGNVSGTVHEHWGTRIFRFGRAIISWDFNPFTINVTCLIMGEATVVFTPAASTAWASTFWASFNNAQFVLFTVTITGVAHTIFRAFFGRKWVLRFWMYALAMLSAPKLHLAFVRSNLNDLWARVLTADGLLGILTRLAALIGFVTAYIAIVVCGLPKRYLYKEY